MLAGDNRVAAEAIEREVGIDKVHAELLPEVKVIVMDSAITKHGSVAMFWDVVNDAPVMARASIAKGAAGSDAGIKTGIDH